MSDLFIKKPPVTGQNRELPGEEPTSESETSAIAGTDSITSAGSMAPVPASSSEGSASDAAKPLAERIRPTCLDEVVGQDDVVGPGGILRELLRSRRLPSVVFWGPPGCGKTTLACLLAEEVGARFVPFSAVLGGVAEVRKIIATAEELLTAGGQRTLLFVDEIHRFSKSQQDAFLPHVERGTVLLVGATTENPSFYVNSALLSRTTVVRLEPLDKAGVVMVLRRALSHPSGIPGLDAEEAALELLADLADGDARRSLNLLEQASWVAKRRGVPVSVPLLVQLFKRQPLRHDKSGDAHYDLISAFIKSLRGSSPDAALYWLARLLDSGEDPLFLARRMLIFASEDVGNADPRALQVATAVVDALRFLGMPEGRIVLAQGVTYLATAPKSNASYTALNEAMADMPRHGTAPVPMHLRNAPTALMAEMGAGKEYLYPHDFPGGFVNQRYFPYGMTDPTYYRPKSTGYEKHIAELMDWRRKLASVSDSAATSPGQHPDGDKGKQP